MKKNQVKCFVINIIDKLGREDKTIPKIIWVFKKCV